MLAPFRRLSTTSAPSTRRSDRRAIREWTEAAEAAPDAADRRLGRAARSPKTGGGPAADVGFTGITDARFYINEATIPTVILGPGSLTRGAHRRRVGRRRRARRCRPHLRAGVRRLPGRLRDRRADYGRVNVPSM